MGSGRSGFSSEEEEETGTSSCPLLRSRRRNLACGGASGEGQPRRTPRRPPAAGAGRTGWEGALPSEAEGRNSGWEVHSGRGNVAGGSGRRERAEGPQQQQQEEAEGGHGEGWQRWKEWRSTMDSFQAGVEEVGVGWGRSGPEAEAALTCCCSLGLGPASLFQIHVDVS